jgi:hypothetical protein
MEGDDGLGHGFAGGVEVEAAVKEVSLSHQDGQPSGVGAGAGGGEAQSSGMQGGATNGIDGGFGASGRASGVSPSQYTLQSRSSCVIVEAWQDICE